MVQKENERKFQEIHYHDERSLEDFKAADKCYICNKKYTRKDIKVRDHCHITEKYRGSAHDYCNSKLKINPTDIKIRVV